MPPRKRRDLPDHPRDRLLVVASDLFYRYGIHTVGVDRILAEAGVTRATMYRHFDGKEGLVVAYLDREDEVIRGYFEAAAAAAGDADAATMLGLLIEGVAEDVARYHTRGCPFVNAAAEYPDARSAVRRTVRRHRGWFRSTLAAVLAAAGHPDPEGGAASLVLLRDAALVGAYLDGVDVVVPTFTADARRVAGLAPA